MPTDPTPSRRTLAALVLACLPACGALPMSPSIPVEPFGEVDGQAVQLVTLRNAGGMTARLTNYGAILVALEVPDRDGALADVVLGYDTLQEYVDDDAYFGATVGRVGNRIGGASFELDGETCALAANNGPHHLHGGPGGFSKRVWDLVETRADGDGQAVRMSYTSAAGEEGYPGELVATVTYTLTDDDVLRVEHAATTSAATPVNLVHHSYWNLAGAGSGTIHEHTIRVHADHYTPGDETLLPTGEVAPVSGTPYDLRREQRLGARLEQIPGDPGGFDVNFVLGGTAGDLREACKLEDEVSGRTLRIATDAPGLQLYTGNFLDGRTGKDGKTYPQHGGVCLETQVWPDAIHHLDDDRWPDVVLRPGETYRHVLEHRFGTR